MSADDNSSESGSDVSQVKKPLSKLTGCKNIVFTRRGNAAIKEALRIARKHSDKLLIPYDGGWMTYAQFGEKLGFEVIRVKTVDAKIDLDDLRARCEDAVFIYSVCAGYFVSHDVVLIDEICSANNCFLIEDITGSIGDGVTDGVATARLKVCSFGKDKPLSMGTGGMICSNSQDLSDVDDENLDCFALSDALTQLPLRRGHWTAVREDVMHDLLGRNLLHPDLEGINLVYAFDSEEERDRLIAYCSEKKIEYTLCPREIRVKRDAVSVEIKRL